MGQAKAGIRLPNGLSFVEQACQILQPHVDEIVLLGHGDGAPDAIPRIPDAHQCEGPVAGLLALLRSGKAQEYIVLSCDMPFLRTEFIALLLQEAARRDARIMEERGRLSKGMNPPRKEALGSGFRDGEKSTHLPFPVWLRQDALAPVEAFVASKGKRWMRLLEALPMHWVLVSESDAHQFRNLNCPKDLPWMGSASGSD